MLAGAQHGCISHAQALDCRLSPQSIRRRVAQNRWRRLLPRVYAVYGAPATWEQRLFAALLGAGDEAAVSGLAAAALWEFPDVQPGAVEISHPSKRSRAGVIVHPVLLDRADVTRLGIISLATAPRTLGDVAGRLRESRLDAAVHHCLHRKLTTLDALQDIAGRRGRGCAGAARLRAAVGAYGDDRPAASPLEARLARRIQGSRLPPPRRQHHVFADGRSRYLDFAWPDARVAVEVDGYRWHSSRVAWESDRARLTQLRRAGWTIVHATYDDIHRDSDRLLQEIEGLLRRKTLA